MEINDIPHTDSVFLVDEDMICVRLSSENYEVCEKINNIILTLFGNEKWIYKMIGFEEDLNPSMDICNKEEIKFFNGETKLGFLTASYPELHVEISNQDNLLKLLRNWSSTIYLTQVLFGVSVEDKGGVLSILEEELYRDTDSIFTTWSKVKFAIRNQPEAEYHNTFLLFVHKEDLEAVQKLL